MKNCTKCNKPNRDQALYCKWCGERFEITADDLFGKENIASQMDALRKRCSVVEILRKKNPGKACPGLDCLITGDAGTGKRFIAEKIAAILASHNITSDPRPLLIDAADWDDFNSDLRANLGKNKEKAMVITNCQILTEKNGGGTALDKLFARMRETDGLPIIILCGLEKGFGEYMRANTHVSSLFEFHFNLLRLSDGDLTALCMHNLRREFDCSISGSGADKLRLVIKKLFRDGRTGENGKLSWRIAEESSTNMYARGGETIDPEDIGGEPFKELTEEQIIARLDAFVGLQSVKDEIKAVIRSIKRQKEDNPGEKPTLKSHYIFLGSPGTGKTTIARLYAEILNSLQVLPSGHLVEVTRKDLVADVVGGTALKVEEQVYKAMGGVLFIDEAYDLINSDQDSFGHEVVNALVPLLLNNKGKFICIIAGYTGPMKELLSRANPGFASRFDRCITFEDYKPDELTAIFLNMVKSKGMSLDSQAASKIRSVFEKMYLTRTDTFANARTVGELFDRCIARQNERLEHLSSEARKAAKKTITWTDVVGEEGAKELSIDDVLAELDQFVGMDSVKSAIRTLASDMRYRQMVISRGGKATTSGINIILTGNPGTGKTTVARTLGRVFKAMGVIPSDTVIEKKRADIVTKYSNEAAGEMNKAVNQAMGGVLFLDEAYNIAPFDDMGQCTDSEGLKALEALMTRMTDDAGKFVLVCAGYKNKMDNLLKANEGFARRFTHHIHIEDYTPVELAEIFRRRAGSEGLTLAPGTLEQAILAFKKIVSEQSVKGIRNAGAAVDMVADCRSRIYARIKDKDESQVSDSELFTIHPEDIPYEAPKEVTEDDALARLEELVGLQSIKDEIRAMVSEIKDSKLAAEMEGKEFKAPEPEHYLFLGNPGTGKTTVARLMGDIFHALGMLPRTDVLEVLPRADMVAPYQGQTGPKTRECVKNAMGGILFIDEAYSLVNGPGDEFGQEAINTLVPLMLNNKGKFVCIAAGYTREMQTFLDANSGLKSRFSKVMYFEDYTGAELYRIFCNMARGKGYTIDPGAEAGFKALFDYLYENRGNDFGNARTAGNIFREVRSLLAKRTNAEMDALIASGMSKANAYHKVGKTIIKTEDIPTELNF